MYRCFSLYFLKKCNIVNIEIVLFLLAHLTVFLIICFSSSPINSKKKFRCAPPFWHVCGFFRKTLLRNLMRRLLSVTLYSLVKHWITCFPLFSKTTFRFCHYILFGHKPSLWKIFQEQYFWKIFYHCKYYWFTALKAKSEWRDSTKGQFTSVV